MYFFFDTDCLFYRVSEHGSCRDMSQRMRAFRTIELASFVDAVKGTHVFEIFAGLSIEIVVSCYDTAEFRVLLHMFRRNRPRTYLLFLQIFYVCQLPRL